MNSKQSLRDIYFFDTMKDDHEWEYNKVLTDLEVLDILKKKKVNIYDEIYGNETYEEYMFCRIERPSNLTEKEWLLLKEWLNSD